MYATVASQESLDWTSPVRHQSVPNNDNRALNLLPQMPQEVNDPISLEVRV